MNFAIYSWVIVFSVCITKGSQVSIQDLRLYSLLHSEQKLLLVIIVPLHGSELLTTRGNINGDLNKMNLQTKNFIVGMIIDDC